MDENAWPLDELGGGSIPDLPTLSLGGGGLQENDTNWNLDNPNADGATHAAQEGAPPESASKRKAACLACRQRKVKCSGTKPICERCVRFSKKCVYGLGVRKPIPQALKEVRSRLCWSPLPSNLFADPYTNRKTVSWSRQSRVFTGKASSDAGSE